MTTKCNEPRLAAREQTQLPDAIMRVWDKDAPTKIGGWIELAGGDPAECFTTREFKHPWVGLAISFPKFEEQGFIEGIVERCLSHPLGELMFDVRWPEPVGSILYNIHDGHYIYNRTKSCIKRYRAHRLKILTSDNPDAHGCNVLFT